MPLHSLDPNDSLTEDKYELLMRRIDLLQKQVDWLQSVVVFQNQQQQQPLQRAAILPAASAPLVGFEHGKALVPAAQQIWHSRGPDSPSRNADCLAGPSALISRETMEAFAKALSNDNQVAGGGGGEGGAAAIDARVNTTTTASTSSATTVTSTTTGTTTTTTTTYHRTVSNGASPVQQLEDQHHNHQLQKQLPSSDQPKFNGVRRLGELENQATRTYSMREMTAIWISTQEYLDHSEIEEGIKERYRVSEQMQPAVPNSHSERKVIYAYLAQLHQLLKEQVPLDSLVIRLHRMLRVRGLSEMALQNQIVRVYRKDDQTLYPLITAHMSLFGLSDPPAVLDIRKAIDLLVDDMPVLAALPGTQQHNLDGLRPGKKRLNESTESGDDGEDGDNDAVNKENQTATYKNPKWRTRKDDSLVLPKDIISIFLVRKMLEENWRKIIPKNKILNSFNLFSIIHKLQPSQSGPIWKSLPQSYRDDFKQLVMEYCDN